MKNRMEIRTERLLITEFDESMIESVHLHSQDEETRRFVPDEVFETIEDAREVVEFLISAYESTSGPFVYPILLHDGKNIGYVQAVPIKDGYEVGYHMAEAHRGKGYTTEALQAFLPVIMDQLSIERIYGICHGENVPSQRVLEKTGFLLEYKGMSPYQGKTQEIVKYKYSL
ncbi:GNAT family N-acetyltransferase [Proteiniclasticum sp. C24MP]|uniref:GNAT family N-acetyltransferase n=1 Tax=Proteiniclasticum sp. C24MP TaxID=3374101 RepID=UPI0037542552